MSDELDAIAIAICRIRNLGVDTSTIPPDVLRRLVNEQAIFIVQTQGEFSRWAWCPKEWTLRQALERMI